MIKRLIAKWLATMKQQDLERARQHVQQYTQGSFK